MNSIGFVDLTAIQLQQAARADTKKAVRNRIEYKPTSPGKGSPAQPTAA